jgi:hypothetical protein
VIKKMSSRPGILVAVLFMMVWSTVARTHQVTSGTHQHVWRSTTYGKDYRPGHAVEGSTGGITIWSPSTLNEYGSANSVQFAQPVPFNKKPAKQSTQQVLSQPINSKAAPSQSNTPIIKSLAPSRYGKVHKRAYGQ